MHAKRRQLLIVKCTVQVREERREGGSALLMPLSARTRFTYKFN